MQDWKHERCGTVLTVPYDGVKNIKCDGCGTIVSVPNGTKPAANHSNESGRTEAYTSQNWGGLRPQIVEKKPKYDSVFSSEIVKVGKTLTKHTESGKSLKLFMFQVQLKF